MNENNNPVPFYNNLHFYQQLFKISFSILINFILNLGRNRLERSGSLFIPLGNSLDLLIGSGSFASAFYSYFSNCMSLGETVYLEVLRGCFVRVSLCSLSEYNFFDARAVFSVDFCHVFAQCVLAQQV